MPESVDSHVSKVIFGGEVLMDLTGDTVTPETLLQGVTAHGKDGAPIEGACAFDVDSSDATATVAELLVGRTAYARGAKFTGTMPNNEGISGTITNKNDIIAIPQGYHDGSGSVKMDPNEAAKLIPQNIREGTVIFGVTGTMSGTEAVTAQTRTVIPTVAEQIILPEEGYNYLSQVTVSAIPYTQSQNSAGGMTVTIGG